VSSVVALLGISLPNFALGPLMILLFAVTLRWLPVRAWRTFAFDIPAITLGACAVSILIECQVQRAGRMNEDYVRTARAKS